MDLLNEFAAAVEKEKHLNFYRGLVRRARPYMLDDDATALITELASGPTIQDKLATYRILARLPFDVMWLEFDYEPRFLARVALGTSVGEKPVDAPERMGWLLERLTDTSWRATTVIQYAASATESGRTVDVFGVAHIVSTEGPVEFRSWTRDQHMRQAVVDANKPEPGHPVALLSAMAWGFGAAPASGSNVYSISLPQHLYGSNAVDLPPSWEPIIEKVSKGVPSEKVKLTRRHMTGSSVELQGDLRFLMAALATLNEVPVTYTDVRPPGTRRIGGQIKEFMVNRVVKIALPKRRGRANKVLKLLKLAEVRMRRHEVSGYWRRTKMPDGTVERKWINSYMRGDASLGYVRQVREVVERH